MKKSLIALAVAGAFAAPAFAATSNVDVYGSLRFAIEDTDVSGVDMDVKDQVSRIGFKGSEDLGGGLKAIWQIEQQIDAAGGSTLDSGTSGPFGGKGLRNTFVGLAGGFGTFVIGRHDTPYKIATGKYDLFADTIADYNGTTLDGVQLVNKTHDARASNAVAYISPSFSGLTIAAAVVPSTDNLDTGESLDAYSLAGMYANGPLTVDLAYQKVRNYSTAWKIGAGYTMGDLTLDAMYEDSNDAQDQQGWNIGAKYAMGPIILKAIYGQVDKGSLDQDMFALGADYKLSKRTTAYVIFGKGDDDQNSDVSGWNLGIRHDF